MERQGTVQEAVRVEAYKRSQTSHNTPSSDDSGRWQQPPPRPAVAMYRCGADSVYNQPGSGLNSRFGIGAKPGHSSSHAEAALRHPREKDSTIQSSGRVLCVHSPANSSQSHSSHVSSIQQQAAQHARAQATSIPAGSTKIQSLPAHFSRTAASSHQHASSSRANPDQHRQLRATPTTSLADHRASLPGASSGAHHSGADSRGLTATMSHRSYIPATHGATTPAAYRSSATGVTPGTRPASSRSRLLGQSRSRSTSRPAQSSSCTQPLHAGLSDTPTARFANTGATSHTSANALHRRDSTGGTPLAATGTAGSSAMSSMSVGSSMGTASMALSTQRSTMHPSDTPRHEHRRDISEASSSGAMETLSDSSSSAIHHAQQHPHSSSPQMHNSSSLTRQHSHASQHSQSSAPLVRHPSARSALPQQQLPPQPALERLQRNIAQLPCLHELAREGHGVVGLRNLGNTCFMNSMLQCLAAVPDLLRFMLTRGQIMEKKGSYLTAEYKDLMRTVAGLGPDHSVSPSSFLSKMQRVDAKWGARAQQDSHEFLLALLDRLQTEGDRNDQKPRYRELVGKGSVAEQAATAAAYAREWSDSWIDDTFGGLLQSTVECQHCGDKSFRFDTCLDLSVPLPSARVSTAKFGPDGVPLALCLRKFIEPEVLDVEYKCEECGHATSRRKWLQLFTPPRNLVLHLNRFSQGGMSDGCGGSPFTGMRKNSTAVNIPARLDMTRYCSQLGLAAVGSVTGATPFYKLIAVSEHSGGMGGGHYTATTRSATDRFWYGFNDSHVSGPTTQPPCGPSSSAYVLVYRMCTATSSSGGTTAPRR